MVKKYEVTGACVTHIPTVTTDGVETRITAYQGAILPDTVPAERIKHLLDVNLIKEVGGQDQATEPQVNARSSKADLIEYAVQQGAARDEAEAMTRDQLLDRYVR